MYQSIFKKGKKDKERINYKPVHVSLIKL